MADRSYNSRPADCQSCFDTWCWDGTTDNTTTPSTEYAPVVGTVPSFISSRGLGSGGAAVGTSNAIAASSSSVAASASVSARSGAGRSLRKGGMGVWIGVGMAVVGGLLGSLAVMV